MARVAAKRFTRKRLCRLAVCGCTGADMEFGGDLLVCRSVTAGKRVCTAANERAISIAIRRLYRKVTGSVNSVEVEHRQQKAYVLHIPTTPALFDTV